MMVLASLFLCIGGLFAQTRVTGTVISQDDGEPVIGATIRVSGTNVGTVTDSNGSFTITCPEGRNRWKWWPSRTCASSCAAAIPTWTRSW